MGTNIMIDGVQFVKGSSLTDNIRLDEGQRKRLIEQLGAKEKTVEDLEEGCLDSRLRGNDKHHYFDSTSANTPVKDDCGANSNASEKSGADAPRNDSGGRNDQEYKRWRADRRGEYFYVGDDGNIEGDSDALFTEDEFRYATGNYFKTEEEAVAYREYLMALQEVKDSNNGFKPDWFDEEQVKHSVCHCTRRKGLIITFDWVSNHGAPVYFATEEDLKKSIKEHEDAWKIVLGVE